MLAARARLRQAEHENERLRRLLDLLAEDPAGARRGVAGPRAAAAAGDGAERCLLYVGGHCSLLPTCAVTREARRLELLHHDGGEEHSLHVLEGLVGRAEAVFCPIDCVSHQACLAAKQLCRRLDKPFVPLRTGSGTCFLRAIDRWRAVGAGGPCRGVRQPRLVSGPLAGPADPAARPGWPPSPPWRCRSSPCSCAACWRRACG